MKHQLRYANGRFAPKQYDKRRYVFDYTGDAVYVPKIGVVQKKYLEFEPVPVTKKRRKEKPEQQLLYDFKDRVHDRDIYAYLGEKNFNQIVKKIKKDNPKKVVTCIVEIQIGKRRFITRQFKVTDIKGDVRFQFGKRKGRKYTAKDVAAWWIHKTVENTKYTLYKEYTDTHELVRRKGKRAKYSKKQNFQIRFQTVSKKSAKPLPQVVHVE